jgi:hypothetical protein
VQPPHCVPHVAEAVAMNEMRRTLIICIFDDSLLSVVLFLQIGRAGEIALCAELRAEQKNENSVGSDGGSRGFWPPTVEPPRNRVLLGVPSLTDFLLSSTCPQQASKQATQRTART